MIKEEYSRQQATEKYIRLLDIVVATFSICISFPLLMLIALLIKIEDPKAPILFRQIRLGKDNVPFTMYKFRSMVVGAEEKIATLTNMNEMDGPMFKIRNDPRITRLGKYIRKTSIDEFPQLWNVLRGEMSLVGPRPPLIREVAQYKKEHYERLKVLPGCTGLWQVSGRNKLSFEEMVSLDLYYIQNRTVALNVKILLLTFKEFAGKGM